MGLEDVLRLATQYKALKIKVADIEIELHESAFKVIEDQPRIAIPIGELAGMPTEDELLFWSVGGEDIQTKEPEVK